MATINAKFFSSLLTIVPVEGNNVYEQYYSNHCSNYIPSSADSTTGIPNSDMHIYVTSSYESTASFIAWASSCAFAPDGRPRFGRINFNEYYFPETMSDFTYVEYTKITTHELFHAMGFSSSLYSSFRDASNNY